MIGDLSQESVCVRYESAFVPPHDEDKLGVALATLGHPPLNALRHRPENGTCGWYIWGGDFSQDPEFFQSLHVRHIVDYAPNLVPFLALAPGSRVLLAPGQLEVWHDPSLLTV